MRNPFRHRHETLREMQSRIAAKLGYVPLVFGTTDEETGRTTRAYWDVRKQEWIDVR